MKEGDLALEKLVQDPSSKILKMFLYVHILPDE